MTAPQTITAQFRDGPLAGTQVECDIEKHTHTDRKTGAEYVRQTEWDVMRGTLATYFYLRQPKQTKAN